MSAFQHCSTQFQLANFRRRRRRHGRRSGPRLRARRSSGRRARRTLHRRTPRRRQTREGADRGRRRRVSHGVRRDRQRLGFHRRQVSSGTLYCASGCLILATLDSRNLVRQTLFTCGIHPGLVPLFRTLRVTAMNDPVSFSHAAIGREMHFFNRIYGSSHRWQSYAQAQVVHQTLLLNESSIAFCICSEGGGDVLAVRRAQRPPRRAVQPPGRELHLDEAGQGGTRQGL